MTTSTQPSYLTVSRPDGVPSFESACLIMGQLAMCASTFFWNVDGGYSVDAATIIVLSMVLWAVGLPAVFALFRDSDPWYARIGLLYAIYGCIGGVAFGFEGLFSEIFNLGSKIGIAAHEKFPMQLNLVLYWSGPAFPLSMLILGAFLMYRKRASLLTAILLIVGALAFPLSRIVRVERVAHLADLVLLAAIVLLVVTGKSACRGQGNQS